MSSGKEPKVMIDAQAIQARVLELGDQREARALLAFGRRARQLAFVRNPASRARAQLHPPKARRDSPPAPKIQGPARLPHFRRAAAGERLYEPGS